MFHRQPQRDHPGGQLTQRAEGRAGEHTCHEAVDQRHQQPTLSKNEKEDGLEHDAGGDHASGRFVHRIGKPEQAL